MSGSPLFQRQPARLKRPAVSEPVELPYASLPLCRCSERCCRTALERLLAMAESPGRPARQAPPPAPTTHDAIQAALFPAVRGAPGNSHRPTNLLTAPATDFQFAPGAGQVGAAAAARVHVLASTCDLSRAHTCVPAAPHIPSPPPLHAPQDLVLNETMPWLVKELHSGQGPGGGGATNGSALVAPPPPSRTTKLISRRAPGTSRAWWPSWPLAPAPGVCARQHLPRPGPFPAGAQAPLHPPPSDSWDAAYNLLDASKYRTPPRSPPRPAASPGGLSATSAGEAPSPALDLGPGHVPQATSPATPLHCGEAFRN